MNRKLQLFVQIAMPIAVYGSVVTPGENAVWLSRGDAATFKVEDGQTALQSGILNAEKGASVEKVGKGTMRLPLANVTSSDELALSVREGTLSIQSGTQPIVGKPTELLNRAAIWLDAAKNVIEVTDSDGSHVQEWRDCRETESAAPFAHYHGYVSRTSDTASVWPIKTTGNLGAAIDFRGYGSYCCLGFQDPSSDAVPTAVANMARITVGDVFVVHSITRSGNGTDLGGWGFIIGTTGDEYHPQNALFSLNKYWIKSECATSQESRWWLNGLEFDATAEMPALGDYVYDIKHYNVKPKACGLCLYSNPALPNRAGGDLIYEVLLFAEKLTEAEHAQIRRYLTDKYSKTPETTGPRSFLVAENAALNLEDVSSGVSVIGAGSISKNVGTDFIWNYYPGLVFGGRYNLSGGDSAKSVLREDLTLRVMSGGVLATENVDYGAKVSIDASDETVFQKVGDLNARVDQIPETVKKVEVVNGVLSVAPGGMAGDSVPPSETGVAEITNPDFQLDSPTMELWMNGSKPATQKGWTCVYSPGYQFGDSYALITVPTAGADGTAWYKTNTKPDGDAYLAMRGDTMLYTTFHVSVSGRYDLDFDIFHQGGWPYCSFSVWIGKDLDHLELAGGVPQFVTGMWERRTVRTPFVTKGTDWIVALRMNTYYNASDTFTSKSHYFVDNLAMRFVPETQTVFPVPNGDFEWLDPNAALANKDTKLENRKFGDYTATGWEFVQPGWTVKTTTGLALFGANNTDENIQYANSAMVGCGAAQLLIASTSGCAKVTFAAPAGRWRLRAYVSPWRKSNIVATMKHTYATGGLVARVKVGEATMTSLGKVSLPGLQAKVASWDASFDVPSGGATAVLELSCADTDSCGALVDNLELVSDSAVGNLVKDGDFELGFAQDRWIADTSRQIADTPCARVAAARSAAITGRDVSQYDSPLNDYRGGTGTYCAYIGDCGAIYQTVTVPTAGRYRFSYYTRARYYGANESLAFCYAGNRFRSILISGSGETNVLDEVSVLSTNWVAHAAMVTIKNAGTYVLRVEGLNVPTVKTVDRVFCSGWDKRGFIDGVALAKISDGGAPEATPFDGECTVTVAKGAKLRLDYTGTNHVEKIKLGGRTVSGVISAETNPDYIIGEGAIQSDRKGLMMICK